MKLGTYIIGQSDSIELLAQILLGDYRLAETLIKLNKLRYPYISDDPIDQFANPKGTILLVGSYTNATSIVINNINSLNILPNDTIFFSESSTAYGVVQSIIGSTIIFVSAITGSFDAGAVVTVFSNQQNVTMQVLRTGNSLYYPFDPTTAIKNNTNYDLLLGTDLQLDSNGFLVRLNGDIATVSGFANLAQALTSRYKTMIGTLSTHLNYGNKLFTILGKAGTPYFSGLAKHYAKECAMQDPRVQTIDVTDFLINQDQILFTLKILPIGAQDTISQPIKINL